jgi:hypothetical protein
MEAQLRIEQSSFDNRATFPRIASRVVEGTIESTSETGRVNP